MMPSPASCLRAFFLCMIFAAMGHFLFAQEQKIVLGGRAPWQILTARNLMTKEGLRGYPSLVLAAYTPENGTPRDLALTFEAPNIAKVEGRYELENKTPLFVSTAYARRGSGVALFVGNKMPLVLQALDGSLFSPNSMHDAFTIDLWLFSNQNHDSEVVLSWKGLIENNQAWRNQSLKASFTNGTLKWTFENLFYGAGRQDRTIEIKGTTPLKPHSWSRHLLHYDARTGLLEYNIDGRPAAITQVYDPTDPHKSPLSLFIGSINDRRLIFGENFTGALDDIFIDQSWQECPIPYNYAYTNQEAEFISQVLDLTSAQSHLLNVSVLQETPNATYIDYHYRLGNEITFERDPATGKNLKRVKGEWRPLPVNISLSELARGRYLQIKATFLGEGTGQSTPSLSQIQINYLPNVPSNAPTIVKTQAHNGAISLEWLPSLSSHVKGYRVYFGTKPKVYHGTVDKDSPIDVGNTTQYTLEGLINGQIYYLSVVAYGEGDPPSLSSFSTEVNARPLDSYASFNQGARP